VAGYLLLDLPCHGRRPLPLNLRLREATTSSRSRPPLTAVICSPTFPIRFDQ
jgi:hypothetical protein